MAVRAISVFSHAGKRSWRGAQRTGATTPGAKNPATGWQWLRSCSRKRAGEPSSRSGRLPSSASRTRRPLTGPGADELLELVAPLGLGAQRVARLRAMAAHFDAGSPACPPGMGPYGYGVVVLASGQIPEVAPVDGNLARVVSRVNGWRFERGEARKKPEPRAAVRELLAGVRAAERLAILYALVDVGATLCKRVHPDCVRCPLQSSCVWATQPARGDQKVQ